MKAVPALVRNPKQILLLKNTRFLLLLKQYVEELIASARCNLVVVITGRLAVGIYIYKSSLDIHTYIYFTCPRGFSCSIIYVLSSVPDPDLEIRGREGGGVHPDPELRVGGSRLQIFFWLFGPQFGLRIRGPWPPRPLPWICHCHVTRFTMS